jgi:hypothetical protein
VFSISASAAADDDRSALRWLCVGVPGCDEIVTVVVGTMFGAAMFGIGCGTIGRVSGASRPAAAARTDGGGVIVRRVTTPLGVALTAYIDVPPPFDGTTPPSAPTRRDGTPVNAASSCAALGFGAP